jgi:predicted nucleic acid-binding protein
VTRYLDSSALVKLVLDEDESEALHAFMEGRVGEMSTAALARTEVARAVAPHGPGKLGDARRLLGTCSEITLSRHLLDRVGALAHELGLRSLDAIHLAAAEEIRPYLSVVVTYDQRMAEGARRFGFEVAMPGVA